MGKEEEKEQKDEIDRNVLRKYDIIKRIGKGAYGIVFKGRCKKNKKIVAVKKIFGAFQNSTDAQRTYREIMFLYQLNGHDNIIKLMDVMKAKNDNDIYLVFDYMETDLHEVIRADLLEEIHKKYIIYQLLRALKYIHSGLLLHRDIKPSNILLNAECHIKVADFGLARSISTEVNENKIPVLTDYVATRWYRAPEILLGSTNYTEGVDMWSLGCIMAELAIGKPLFRGNSTMNQLERIIEITGKPNKKDIEDIKSPFAETIISSFVNIKKRNFSDIFHKVSKDSLDLLQKMLQFNPSKRISAENALKHKYVEQFHFLIDEPVCRRIVTIPVDDSTKFKVNFYRNIVYSDIMRRKKCYAYQQPLGNGHSKRGPSLLANSRCKMSQAEQVCQGKIAHEGKEAEEAEEVEEVEEAEEEEEVEEAEEVEEVNESNRAKEAEGVVVEDALEGEAGTSRNSIWSSKKTNNKMKFSESSNVVYSKNYEHINMKKQTYSHADKKCHNKKGLKHKEMKNIKISSEKEKAEAYCDSSLHKYNEISAPKSNEKYYYEHNTIENKNNRTADLFYYKALKSMNMEGKDRKRASINNGVVGSMANRQNFDKPYAKGRMVIENVNRGVIKCGGRHVDRSGSKNVDKSGCKKKDRSYLANFNDMNRRKHEHPISQDTSSSKNRYKVNCEWDENKMKETRKGNFCMTYYYDLTDEKHQTNKKKSG
ncbi:mitogen-activated protein kinase 1, putative [Plasmodium malariae]|uniref:Mitogen-activated protein kinase n=1 Tax=Plasmodium malariae TaxID=5858 RepID=A0A1C3KEW1_PLAMA|nr:mitogen-activated protein kinase 1, putative [Plasmodium malariae]